MPYSKDGVDLSLIQWMLSFTPTERLQILQNTIRSIIKLRGDQSNLKRGDNSLPFLNPKIQISNSKQISKSKSSNAKKTKTPRTK